MSAPIYAVIDPTGKIVNVIHWDGKAVYDASPNTLQPVTNTPPHIGGTFKDGIFSPPPTLTAEPQASLSVWQRMSALFKRKT